MEDDKSLHYAQNRKYRPEMYENCARNIISQKACADIYRVRKNNDKNHFLYKVFVEYAEPLTDKEFEGLQREGAELICKVFGSVFCYKKGELCELTYKEAEKKWNISIRYCFCEFFTVDIMSRFQDFLPNGSEGYEEYVEELSNAYIKNKFCKEYVDMVSLTMDYIFRLGLYAKFMYSLRDSLYDCMERVELKKKKRGY